MGVVVIPGTAHAKEVLKWEYDTYRLGDDYGQRGPRLFVEFPKMLYRAGRDQRNQINVIANETAGNPDEEARLIARGFHVSQESAIDAATAAEREIAKLAANRAFQDRKLSEPAQAEAAAYDASTPAHVAEIPAQPIKRRGRPKKSTE